MSTDRPISYRKFSGVRGGLVGMEQLWLGDDHLLLVNSSFAVERYRRFYFQDIEAFVIRPTTTQRNWVIADCILAAIFGGFVLYLLHGQPSSEQVGAAVFFGAVGALFLIGLIVQLVKGPSCATFLQLRTGLERLGVANRVRASLKMQRRLAALIGARAEATAVALAASPTPEAAATP